MKKSKSDPTKTVLTITVGFIIIYMITKLDWVILVSLIVGFLGIFSNYFRRKIDFIWMKLTWILGLIIPNILLTLIYFIFLFPISWLSRLTRKSDPLILNNKSDSIYVITDKKFDKDSFEKLW